MSDAMAIVLDAAGKWRDELTEYIMPDADNSGAEEDAKGYEAEAEAISDALAGLEPLDVYFTGDLEGPDKFGLIYDTEEAALECVQENGGQVWKVPVVPNWGAATDVTPKGGDDA